MATRTSQHAEQDEENGHHDFIQALNAARYAERHNGQRNGERCHMVSNAAKWPGDRAEERRHIGLRQQRSACRLDEVFDEPADDHGIANGNAECAQHGNDANNAADFVTVFTPRISSAFENAPIGPAPTARQTPFRQ